MGLRTEAGNYNLTELQSIYRALLKPRLIEELMLRWLRQGHISKWFSGIGQEAVSVGVARAVESDDYLLTLHRNLGVFTSREVPLKRLFAQFRGTSSGFTKGRDRSFHFGLLEHHIIGMISHLGPQLAVANGVGLAAKLQCDRRIAVAFCGDGATSEGDFHEALNVAAVWDLPVLFVIENNGYGLSTPVKEQYQCESLHTRAAGYGMEGRKIDGNNFFTVYETVRKLADKVRKEHRPILLECKTFRIRGHEEASGVAYVPPELIDKWTKKDPIRRFEKKTRNALPKEDREEIRSALMEEITREAEESLRDPPVSVSLETEKEEVFSQARRLVQPKHAGGGEQTIRFVDAVTDALRTALREIPELILMGQDIAQYGGVFKVTKGFLEEFGAERIRNTPLCESAILGSTVGLAARGIPSVVEMQFSDFVSSGFTQVVNNIAKSYYRWGLSVPTVIRMPCGAGVGAGPFHSQTNEAWFVHTPGLKVAYPSTPADAKTMLLASIVDDNPVLFFEHKKLYRSLKGPVPDGWVENRSYSARVVREGTDAAIVTYGLGVQWAEEVLREYPSDLVEVVDLRWLKPIDWDCICRSVEKTGRVLVLGEASQGCSVVSEVAAGITERCFESLDAPVFRCSSLDTPVPFCSELEQQYLARARLPQALEEMLNY